MREKRKRHSYKAVLTALRVFHIQQSTLQAASDASGIPLATVGRYVYGVGPETVRKAYKQVHGEAIAEVSR